MFKSYINNEQFNFQINRFLEPYYANVSVQQTIKKSVSKITDEKSWYTVWKQLGLVEEKNGQNALASAYYQLADFFLSESDPHKNETYAAFRKTFYKSISMSKIAFDTVPYDGINLPVAKLEQPGATKTLLFHGGFDSYLEEIIRLTLNEGLLDLKNYNFILFEGPGQGQALKNGLAMTHEWEKPVRKILDYYDLKHADLMGMSLGGYLAMRAAAFEPRIDKVIAFDVYYSMLDSLTMKLPQISINVLAQINNPLVAAKIDAVLDKASKGNVDLAFKIRKGNEIMHTNKATNLIKNVQKYTLAGIENHVRQDVLLLAGSHDMYVPTSALDFEAAKLVNAKSVTKIMFDEQSGGERHCQVGNKKLAFDKIKQFLKE